jgi:hypothetical protein
MSADKGELMMGYVDQALDALGGEDSDFIVKVGKHGIDLDCRVCGQGVYAVGAIELWELVADAREHWEQKHAQVSP